MSSSSQKKKKKRKNYPRRPAVHSKYTKTLLCLLKDTTGILLSHYVDGEVGPYIQTIREHSSYTSDLFAQNYASLSVQQKICLYTKVYNTNSVFKGWMKRKTTPKTTPLYRLIQASQQLYASRKEQHVCCVEGPIDGQCFCGTPLYGASSTPRKKRHVNKQDKTRLANVNMFVNGALGKRKKKKTGLKTKQIRSICDMFHSQSKAEKAKKEAAKKKENGEERSNHSLLGNLLNTPTTTTTTTTTTTIAPVVNDMDLEEEEVPEIEGWESTLAHSTNTMDVEKDEDEDEFNAGFEQ